MVEVLWTLHALTSVPKTIAVVINGSNKVNLQEFYGNLNKTNAINIK